MSVFNMVCKAAEKSGNSLLISAMNKSKLFLIERKAMEFEKLQPLIDYVRSEIPLLPFDTCAIEVDMIGADNPEYNVPGIIIIDVSRSTEDDGLRNYDFNFWVGFKLGSVLTLLAGDGFVYENYAAKFMQMLSLLEQESRPESDLKDYEDDKLSYQLKVRFFDDIIMYSSEGDYSSAATLSDIEPGSEDKRKQEVTNVFGVWFRIFTSLVNTDKHFVLEEAPKGYVETPKPKKILREHQRPKYTVLAPMAIRRKLGIAPAEAEGHKSPAPHERRRHKRRLRKSSGYKEDRDIIIEATWVGVSEVAVGNKVYKVRLDI